MPRRKISNTQAVCILFLWFLLVYMLLRYSPTVDFMTVFTIIASGVIVFVPLYKNRRHKDRSRPPPSTPVGALHAPPYMRDNRPSRLRADIKKA